jgi:HD superfamily phosphodiesterase
MIYNLIINLSYKNIIIIYNMDLLNYLFNFVILTSKLFNIDESHALKHSMDVYYFSNKIYESELLKNAFLNNHKNIIDTSAILHDMSDKKYINEKIGLYRISEYMKNKITDNEINISLKIISTMSYSTVKKNGFPNLGEYQLAYNIVREADLLASYDFDRCIMYQMLKNNDNYMNSFLNAKEVFENRVFKYNDNKLFTTEYSIKLSNKLHKSALKRINNLSRIHKI